jgi:hypothetical protein
MADAQDTKTAVDFTLDETLSIIRAGGNDTLADLLAENSRGAGSEQIQARDEMRGIVQEAATAAARAVMAEVIPLIERSNERCFQMAMQVATGQKPRPVSLPAPTAGEIASPRQAFEDSVRRMARECNLFHAEAHTRIYRDLSNNDQRDYMGEAKKKGITTIEWMEENGLLLRGMMLALDYCDTATRRAG